jgi:molybdate transport system substrate-binding protein
MRLRTATIFLFGVIIGALLTAPLYLAPTTPSKSIAVFAGAAAAPVYGEAAKLFKDKYGVKVELRLGGSGSVLSAMKIAKTGDLFIPGSPEFLLEAAKSNIIDKGSVKKLAYLVPAIIVQKGNPHNITSLEDLCKPGLRVGIADPVSVCVGLYAKELLEKNGLWDGVKRNIVVYAQSCDATAALIPTGAVDVIIGWHVFADWYPDKAERIWIEPSKVPKIGYIAGAVSVFAEDKVLAKKFLDFLASEEVARIWSKYGYFASEQEARRYAPNAVIEDIV